MSALEPNQASNLQSGFRKCSVYPVNVNELLTKFRERESYDREALEDSFQIFLQDKFKSLEPVRTNKRKKKLPVPAGKSVSIEDLEKFNEGYNIASKNPAKRKKQTTKMNTIKSKHQSEEGPKECHDHSSSSKAFSNKKKSEKLNSKNWTSVQREEGEFVFFTYEDELFPGQITIVKENDAYVKSMVKTLKA